MNDSTRATPIANNFDFPERGDKTETVNSPDQPEPFDILISPERGDSVTLTENCKPNSGLPQNSDFMQNSDRNDETSEYKDYNTMKPMETNTETVSTTKKLTTQTTTTIKSSSANSTASESTTTKSTTTNSRTKESKTTQSTLIDNEIESDENKPKDMLAMMNEKKMDDKLVPLDGMSTKIENTTKPKSTTENLTTTQTTKQTATTITEKFGTTITGNNGVPDSSKHDEGRKRGFGQQHFPLLIFFKLDNSNIQNDAQKINFLTIFNAFVIFHDERKTT